jgi:hypothetical protein
MLRCKNLESNLLWWGERVIFSEKEEGLEKGRKGEEMI